MQQYIIGNWKMNGTKAEAQKLATGFLSRIQKANRPLPHIVLCPSYPYLVPVIEILKDSPIEVGGQDAHFEKSGAFTGDVSVTQLADVGCKYVIVGHSERRHYHQESSSIIRKKIEASMKLGLRPILCIGESIEERKAGKALNVVASQLISDLPDSFTPHDLLIAYEPLWAIGSGHVPTLEEVEEIMGLMKHELSARISGSALVPTLYGGSVNAQNAPDLLALPHVDGLLVGGVSLKLDEFWEVINASQR
ncbi:MAG: triose-phosphate isomerase [Alphaproteobacteria bacterium 41-28]|nr:MAG: triose-phosphate isomerase [Alphaproteobacteria bacterium 41-28]